MNHDNDNQFENKISNQAISTYLINRYISLKEMPNGAITRFKTRQIIQGYLQRFNIDFNEIFAVVIKMMIFRVVFAIAAYYNLDINEMHIKTSFFIF